jgi:hypothetical protein
MDISDELKAAQIRAAADLTAAVLGHVAPKWEEGRLTVEGLSSFAIDLYANILEGITRQTSQVYSRQNS